MDFTLDPDQLALRATVRRLLEKADRGSPLDEGQRHDVLGQLAGLGLLELAAGGPADVGESAALGPVEVLVVAEELGRTRVRVPFSEALVAAHLLTELGTEVQRDTWLTGAAAGTELVVLAHAEPRAPVGPAAHTVSAEPDGDLWKVSGTKEPVSYGGRATAFLVTAVTAAGDTRLFLVPRHGPGVTVTGYDTHDHAGAARLDLAAAVAEPLGHAEVAGEPAVVRTAMQRATAAGAVALCAEAVGAMDVALWTTVDHLKTRHQFGLPLRTFQALQHRAADMFIEVEMARSMVAYATMALGEPEPDPLAVSRAKVQVGRSSRFVGQNAIQLHGGIGITDEHPIGHYAARLEAIEHTFGGVGHHLGLLADALDIEAPLELLA